MRIMHVLICVLLVGWHAGQPTSSVERAAEDVLSALRAKDVERVLAYYEGGPDFIHVDNGTPVTWPQLEAGIRQFLLSVRVNDLQWDGRPRVLMLNDTTAVVHGWHRVSGVAGDGTPLPAHRGYWSGTFRKSASGWRIVHSHSSTPAVAEAEFGHTAITGSTRAARLAGTS